MGPYVFRILRSANGEVILTLVGRINEQNLPELTSVIASERNSSPTILDLKDVTLVDGEVVRYLGQCEADGVKIRNCPAYIRDWIDIDRKRKSRRKQ